MGTRRRNLFTLAFVLSILLHFGTGLHLYLADTEQDKSLPIEIVIIDKSDTSAFDQAQHIVEQSEERLNDEIDKKAKFLSRHNQRVVQETRAAETGKFQNEAKDGPANKANKNQQQVSKEKTTADELIVKKKVVDKSPDGLPTLAALKPQFHWEKVEIGVKNPGQKSQTDDHLKELATGAQTLLSSREFVYYSYYSRIKERLRMFWEPKIKEKINRLFVAGRRIANSEERITKLVITLDKGGKLVRVQVLGESGLKDLDDAAIEAFQAAAPFPNPPNGIVENDGTIKIRWDFILEA